MNVLFFEQGVGKTTIVKGLAQRIAHHDVPDSLLKRLIVLDTEELIGEIYISDKVLKKKLKYFSYCKSSW